MRLPDPYEHDPQRWGVSLAQSAELLLPCLDAAGARSVVEVGAYAGDLTRVLAAWAAEAGARVAAVDPAPQPALVALADTHPQVELIHETSFAALPRMPLPDAVVIDGDHNWYTVHEELQLIAERAGGGALPLLLFHDVCWPHARRDDYFDPEAIPAEHRHPLAGDAGGIVPGEPEPVPGGLPYPRSAAREGGPRNGVLTAVEDFVAGRGGLRLAVVPAFFGFGAVWPEDAPYAGALERLLGPYDRHPVLERLEGNRVHHLAQWHVARAELWREQQRRAAQEAVLRRLLDSSAFALAERLSRARVRLGIARGAAPITREQIRRALDG